MEHKLVEALANLRQGEVLAEIRELKERYPAIGDCSTFARGYEIGGQPV